MGYLLDARDMETNTETPRPRRPFSKARPRKELLAQIQRAQRMREMEGQAEQEEHVAITIAAEDPVPPPPPRTRPFSKARPRKELLAQIQRAQEMRHLEQQENIPPVEFVEEQLDKRTTFDKFVDQLDEEGRVPKSSHPRSALEALLNEEGREYNDSTIASLENIIHPVMDTPPQPPENGHLATNETTPAPSRRHRSEEIMHEDVLASLSKQLYTTQSTIKDANRGLRRISNKIEGSSPSKADTAPRVEEPPAAIKSEPPVEVVPKPKSVPKAETAVKKTNERTLKIRTDPKNAPNLKNPPTNTVARQKTTPQVEVLIPAVDSSKVDHNGKTICAHCGGRYASVWRALWVEFRENFYTYDPKSRFSIRMTRLGWVTAAFLIWLIIESCLCLTWCSTTYGPMMPFVTHYVILEPFRPYVKPYWRFLGWVLDTIFNLEDGEVPGGRSVPSHTLATAAATARATKRVVRSAMEAVDEMGSMWNDEFI